MALITKDEASGIQARIEQGLSPDHRIKVAGRYKPMTLLEYASEKGAVGVAARLIKAGASMTEGSFTPLALATLFGRVKVVKLLLESGADPNVRHSDPPHDRNQTALMTAASTGNARIFDLLMAHGADPKAVTSKGASALSRAVGRSNRHAIERLVKAGCRASGHDLYRPVYDGDLALARLLIRAGADVNVARKQKYGLADLSLLETAIQERGSVQDDDWLGDDQSQGAREIRARDARQSARYLELIKELLRAGADPNRIAVDMSPVYRATKWGDLAVVKLLLKAGARPDRAISQISWKREYEETALHCAVRDGHLEIAQVLIAAGINPDAKDRSGRTALEAVQGQTESTDMEKTDWLASIGVEVEKKQKDNDAAAWERQRARLIALLRRHTKRNK